MYNYQSEKFGDFLKYTFFNDETRNSFSIIPEHGACLLDVNFNGQSIIDGPQTIEELFTNEWYKSNFLFPFPNRLKNGQYNFDGKSFQFRINEKAKNNSLHGFGTQQVFKLVSMDCKETSAEILCRHQNSGVNPAYPFAFSFDVKLCISEPNSFVVELTFKNESQQKLPLGLGWHPYFKYFDKADDVFMKLPDYQFIDLDENGIPTNKLFEYNYFQEKRQINNAVLDNTFKIKDNPNRARVELFSKYGNLVFWQETGPGKFNFLQIFTPSHRRSIAIEPMTCNIDAFNNGDGLIVLKPNEQFSGQFGFVFETSGF